MRRVTLLLATVGMALLLITGVAVADTVDCFVNRECIGTDGPDTLNGTSGWDDMDARQDDDELFGNEGDDWMKGDAYDALDTSTDGNDLLKGGPGWDGLFGYGGNDELWGQGSSDYIFAEESSLNKGEDIVNGGIGNDYIEAKDGVKDTINCGRGKNDVAFFDTGGIDTVVNCEMKNPDFGESEAAAAPTAAAKMSSDKADALRAR